MPTATVFLFVHLRAREACVRQGHTIFLLYGNAVSYKVKNNTAYQSVCSVVNLIFIKFLYIINQKPLNVKLTIAFMSFQESLMQKWLNLT